MPCWQVRGRVVALRERSVALETGAELPFDYLILAPGSTYADNNIKAVGGTAAERQALIEVRAAEGYPLKSAENKQRRRSAGDAADRPGEGFFVRPGLRAVAGSICCQ